MSILSKYRDNVAERVVESWEPRIGGEAASTLADSVFFSRAGMALLMAGLGFGVFFQAIHQTTFPMLLDCIFFLFPGAYCLYKRVELNTDASYQAGEAIGMPRPPVGNIATFDSWLKHQKH